MIWYSFGISGDQNLMSDRKFILAAVKQYESKADVIDVYAGLNRRPERVRDS